eukprot:g31542.t1
MSRAPPVLGQTRVPTRRVGHLVHGFRDAQVGPSPAGRTRGFPQCLAFSIEAECLDRPGGLGGETRRAPVEANRPLTPRRGGGRSCGGQQTETEFIEMVQRHTSDTGRARMLAELFFDGLAREWLDGSLLAVAAEIRAQCLADLPDASGAAERAYQQAFVERNWEEVIEYVLDVNAYLHKIFSSLFEDRKVAITRVQRPQIAAQLGGFFDALTGAITRWGREGRRRKLSDFQAALRAHAAEARAAHQEHQAGEGTCLADLGLEFSMGSFGVLEVMTAGIHLSLPLNTPLGNCILLPTAPLTTARASQN